MACPIVDTPAETKLGIIEILEDIGTSKDLLNLSSTCQTFRKILVPYIFRTITLRNNEKSGASVQSLAEGDYSGHVKELRYQSIHKIPDSFEHDDGSDDEYDESMEEDLLPSSICAILSDLSRFPNLENLSIEFPFGKPALPEDEDGSEWTNAFSFFQEEESIEEVLEQEQTRGWRAIMARSYDAIAIAQNKNSGIKSFELKKLVTKQVSTWNSSQFRRFLSQLEEFKVSIRGNDNGAGWHINVMPSYAAFVSNLGSWFFDHLFNVVSVTLCGSSLGPIGLEGRYNTPFPINADSMPLLKTLHLEYVFIDRDVINFLVVHRETLETIQFNKCFCGVNGLIENGFHWDRLFSTLTKATPKKLTRFKVLPTTIPFSIEEAYGEELQEDEGEEVKSARALLKEDSKRRGFGYAYLDDKYGMLFEDQDLNVEAFLAGQDQKSYDELMTIVEKNAQSASAKLDA